MRLLPLALLLFPLAASGAAPSATAGKQVDCGELECRLFRTPREAFAQVLQTNPRVLGLGEYHELEGEKKVTSSLEHFTRSLLPLLQGKASDLVVETWIKTGSCGEVEKQATARIEETTQRPESTGDDLEKMLLAAADRGVQPHILVVDCEQYEELLTSEGELDAEKLLQLVTRLMRDKALQYLRAPSVEGSAKMVVIYGGALHNDPRPPEAVRDFSFGPDLAKATGDGYVSLDLLVPEFVLRDEDARKEPWFPAFERHASKTKTLLIKESPDSYLLFFPKAR